MIHLTFLVGQLTGAVSRCFVDNSRGHDLKIAGFAGFVEEEVDECALQTCAQSFINGETCAGNLDAEIKINEIILFGQLPVRQRIDGKRRFLSAGFHNDVVFCAKTLGNEFVGHVGNRVEELCALFLGSFFEFFEFGAACLEFCHASLGRFGLFLLAGFHESTDILGQSLLFREHGVEFCLRALAFAVSSEHCVDRRAGFCEFFLFQAANHGLFIFIDLFNRQHIGYLSFGFTAKVAQ